MNTRHFFSGHLWDWLAEGSRFEHHERMQELVASDPACAAEHREAMALRAGLRGSTDVAPEGFENRLKARLAETMAAGLPAAAVVTPPVSLWRRGPLLVITGVAAVMAFALVGTWQGSGPESRAPVASTGTASQDPAPASPAETGLLAEREFENSRDSVTSDTTVRTDAVQDLQPVSNQRENVPAGESTR